MTPIEFAAMIAEHGRNNTAHEIEFESEFSWAGRRIFPVKGIGYGIGIDWRGDAWIINPNRDAIPVRPDSPHALGFYLVAGELDRPMSN